MRESGNPSSLTENVISLAATLVVAESCSRTRRDRLRGTDATELEAPAAVACGLRGDLATARALAHRIRVEHVGVSLSEGEPQAMHEFATMISVSRLVPVVHRMHQRLLSLYPDASSELAEEARLTEKGLRRWLSLDPAEDRRLRAGEAQLVSESPGVLRLIRRVDRLARDCARWAR